MTEKYALRLVERSVIFADGLDVADAITETWEMNQPKPFTTDEIRDHIVAKIIENPPEHSRKASWDLKWESRNSFRHSTARQGKATMSGVVETKKAARTAIRDWAMALSGKEIEMTSPVDD